MVFYQSLFDILRYKWKRTASGQSESETRWDVPVDAMKEVEYRFKHYGHYKTLNGTIVPYEGTSNSFKVQST